MYHHRFIKRRPTLQLILILVFSVFPLICIGNRIRGDKSLYPIRNLQASLTASEGHGTVTALRTSYENNDCVLIVSYSPSESQCNLTQSFWDSRCLDVDFDVDKANLESDSTENVVTSSRKFMTPITFRGAVRKPLHQSKIDSKSLHILQEQSGICLAMTGFASDVKHLVRYVASVVSEYEHLFGGAVPSIHSLARDTMSSYMRDSTAAGGRPFGVQGLIVGNEYNNISKRDKVEIYALDPSGNFRHCISGVASIGRNGRNIQESILRELHEKKVGKVSSNPSSELNISLDMVLKAILKSIYEDISLKDEVATRFEAVIIFEPRHSHCKAFNCALLDHDFILKSCLRSIEALNQDIS